MFATLTTAFTAAPPSRWIFPKPEQYLQTLPTFAEVLGGPALEQRTAYVCEGGAALWLPPGAEPDEDALVALIERGVPASRQPDVFALFGEMAAGHPAESHCYLPLIGVETAFQGRGIGAALMRPVLAECDATGIAAHLEATTVRGQRLYERLGFEAIGCIRMAECPPFFPMLRRPK